MALLSTLEQSEKKQEKNACPLLYRIYAPRVKGVTLRKPFYNIPHSLKRGVFFCRKECIFGTGWIEATTRE